MGLRKKNKISVPSKNWPLYVHSLLYSFIIAQPNWACQSVAAYYFLTASHLHYIKCTCHGGTDYNTLALGVCGAYMTSCFCEVLV